MRGVAGLFGGLVLLVAVGTGDTSSAAGYEVAPVARTISAGWAHACAYSVLSSDASVRCWGDNESGQLGNGTTSGPFDPNPFPREVIGAGSGIGAVAGGLLHTCELAFDGDEVRCWGWNAYGQLGTGDYSDRLTPAGVVGLSGTIKAIAAGIAHTCVATSGTVQCWGDNAAGQLGNGQDGCDPDHLEACRSATPVTVSGLGSVTALAAGDEHTCALTAVGSVSCWGSNTFGQLGSGGPTGPDQRSTRPVGVAGLGSGVKGISAGENHTCAVTRAGAIECWGENNFGQLGDGTTVDRAAPVTVALSGGEAIAAGWDHTCTITTKGGVACWGRNQSGELGDGTIKERHRPVPVVGLGLNSGVREVTGGYQFTCARLDGDDIRCWGRNDFGQVGDGTTTTRLKPVLTLFGCLGEAPTITAKPGETTVGTSGDDVIMGTTGADVIKGDGGFDRICGLGGADTLILLDDGGRVDGGAGDDEIVGGLGVDNLLGGPGDDNITGGPSGDHIEGQAGEDRLRGEGGEDGIEGGDGVDLLLGGEAQDALHGGDGNDVINGGPTTDVLTGDDDNDVVVGGTGNDFMYGGEGDDHLLGGGGADKLDGNDGDDHINGQAGGDTLFGRVGDDFLFGGGDSDFLFGNQGDDYLVGNEARDVLHGGPGKDHDDGGGNGDHCWGEVFEGCAVQNKPG